MTESARLRRRWLYIPFAIAGIILFAYFLLWQAGAREMKKAVGVWVEDQRALGYDISHGKIYADGFPYFLRVHIEEPKIIAPLESQQNWQWATDKLSIDALPYDLNRLIFSVYGEQSITLPDQGTWRISADDFRASIARDKSREWVFSASIADAKGRRDDGATVSIGSLIFDIAPDPTIASTLTLSLTSNNVEAKTDQKSVVFGTLQTSLLMTEFEKTASPTLWRNAGGEIIINGIIATLDTGRFSLAGRVSLDENSFPVGRLQSEIVSPAVITDALHNAGIMSSDDAHAAGAALTLTAIAGGGKIATPIDLKNGTAQIAGIKIAQLPKVD